MVAGGGISSTRSRTAPVVRRVVTIRCGCQTAPHLAEPIEETHVKYACLIYSDENAPAGDAAPGSPEFDRVMAAYRAFTDDAIAAGIHVVGEPLASTASATSVQLRDGEVITTDGPFAETKEQLGGFYILDCETLDDAISWASRIPTAAFGTIEVRPVPDFG
jgi:hypothetical protein